MSGGRVFAVSVVHVSLILRIALKIASSALVFMKVKIEGGAPKLSRTNGLHRSKVISSDAAVRIEITTPLGGPDESLSSDRLN